MKALSFVLAGAVVTMIACAPSDRAIRLERLQAEKRNLEATFDRLEDRLIVNGSRVRLWQELRVRHESVAAIACASQDEHAAEMAAHGLDGRPRSSLHSKRIATADRAAIERVPASARKQN